jgi:hypothetical protein
VAAGSLKAVSPLILFGVIHQSLGVSNLIQISVAIERRLVTIEPLPQGNGCSARPMPV